MHLRSARGAGAGPADRTTLKYPVRGRFEGVVERGRRPAQAAL